MAIEDSTSPGYWHYISSEHRAAIDRAAAAHKAALAAAIVPANDARNAALGHVRELADALVEAVKSLPTADRQETAKALEKRIGAVGYGLPDPG